MKIFESREEIKNYLGKISKNKTVGFVPTMGALHKGHLSLIRKAREKCDIVVCSIFINPTQFNQSSDFENYPITHHSDVELLQSVNCDVLFLPSSPDEVYKNEQPFSIDLSSIAEIMEGKHRIGHFDGVVRVIKLLFEIISPDKAYFGLKDYQQYLVIKKLVNQLSFPTEIVGCDIIREKDGLAMSSRNTRLTPQQREDALVLKTALNFAKDNFDKFQPLQLVEACMEILEKQSNPEYFEICDASTLQPINNNTTSIRAFTAAEVGEVRLIDNIEIT